LPLQYCHRAVGCQMVHRPVKPFLAIEWLRPGEGEDTAALRLLARLRDCPFDSKKGWNHVEAQEGVSARGLLSAMPRCGRLRESDIYSKRTSN
jgi:hypothetical protein